MTIFGELGKTVIRLGMLIDELISNRYVSKENQEPSVQKSG